jgi:hypothetical protein
MLHLLANANQNPLGDAKWKTGDAIAGFSRPDRRCHRRLCTGTIKSKNPPMTFVTGGSPAF